MLYEFILENKELLKVVYALIISFICALIVLKTDRMFKLSDHQGLRYFRNAFFFYGLSVIVRFIFGVVSISLDYGKIYLLLTKFFFEFFIVSAGFFLLYSLIWRRIEREASHHSILNLRALFFYLLALIFGILDVYFDTNLALYVSQILLFIILSFISYNNYLNGKKGHNFLKYYFFMMLLGLITWIFTMLLDYILDWNKIIQIIVYILNILFFFVFLYLIKKIISRKNG
jgi:hypothetical protein